jgi:hypothetical protein
MGEERVAQNQQLNRRTPASLRLSAEEDDSYEKKTFSGSERLESRLVAITSADGDLVTSLGTTAAENSGTGLGLHAAEKAVRLGATTTIGLKGTLRHGTELLKGRGRPARSFSCCSNF